MSNHSFQDPDLPNGSTINEGNFTQIEADTEIIVGTTLTINGGNFCNVKPQPKWTVNGGLWASKSFCSHLHPYWIEHGLTECEIECQHMISKEEIWIDDVLIDTIYQYEDTLL